VSRSATLALGVDVGRTRTRIALLERDAGGRARLAAVATRPSGEDASRAIAEAWTELGTRERRCILALDVTDAEFRSARFPAMSARERRRAARFEAARFISYPLDDAVVRVAGGAGDCVISVAKRDALEARIGVARRAGLRPLAVDDTAFALLRAFPYADAIVDVGSVATTLILPDEPVPVRRSLEIGGHAFTVAIAASLGIDEASAEGRKRTVGLAGAGEFVRDALVEHIATVLVERRASGRGALRAIALAGNGARLAGLQDALERALAIPVRLAALASDASDALPGDVVRAASPDWGLAYGLALWEAAA
jgi:type IV pilus assembly protein PilM